MAVKSSLWCTTRNTKLPRVAFPSEFRVPFRNKIQNSGMLECRSMLPKQIVKGSEMAEDVTPFCGSRAIGSSPATRILMVTTIARTMDFLLPFARHFRALGWCVDGMAEGISSSPQCVQSFDHVLDIVWSRNPLHVWNFVRAPRAIRAAVANGRYHLVHVHTPVAAFLTRFVLRRLRAQGAVKVVYTAHGLHYEQGRHSPVNRAFLVLEKIAGRWTDYLVIMNAEDEDI